MRGVLDAAEAAAHRGTWVVGYVTYEAGAAWYPDLPWRHDARPLAWFGVHEAPLARPAGGHGGASLTPWSMDWSASEHAERVAAVREAIARGDTYQVNLTTRLRSRVHGDPLALYERLASTAQASYCAYLETPDRTIVSASPELFFARDGSTLTARPMKGTARRLADPLADERNRAELLASPKERAENLMIVDLLRNDLSRVAQTGSVRVPALLDAERYPSVWQLTSTITGQARPGVTLADTFESLFPCGSITGAPKRRTMELIAQLEDAPRGVYCGAIVLIEPGGRACASVAIRTIEVDADGAATYGVGGGITWSSEAAAEYDEVWAKTAVLDGL